jgi:DNA-directed RNA polymerase II subunit RPB1
VNCWLFHDGFSIGIGDAVTGRETMEFSTEPIRMRKQNVKDVTTQASRFLLKPPPSESMVEVGA